MKSGDAYDAAVLTVKKGKCGEPGQLKGTANTDTVIGELLRNTPQGVFGVTKRGWKGDRCPPPPKKTSTPARPPFCPQSAAIRHGSILWKF